MVRILMIYNVFVANSSEHPMVTILQIYSTGISTTVQICRQDWCMYWCMMKKLHMQLHVGLCLYILFFLLLTFVAIGLLSL